MLKSRSYSLLCYFDNFVYLPDQESETVLEVLLKIYGTEGMNGLYKGLVPVIQSLYCSNFVYFYSFHGLKKALNPQKSALNDLLCGMAAGVVYL